MVTNFSLVEFHKVNSTRKRKTFEKAFKNKDFLWEFTTKDKTVNIVRRVILWEFTTKDKTVNIVSRVNIKKEHRRKKYFQEGKKTYLSVWKSRQGL